MTKSATDTDVTTVRIGGLAAVSGAAELKTLLGSCVGVALYDAVSRVGGLAHTVLPNSSGHDGPAGKFVDTAIPELIRQIEALGGTQQRLRAKLAGGANMFATESKTTIGDQNLDAVRHELSVRSIPVVAEHCGGTQGRRMTFRPATGSVCIEVVGCESVEI